MIGPIIFKIKILWMLCFVFACLVCFQIESGERLGSVAWFLVCIDVLWEAVSHV